MENNEKYNGWTNKETWLICLWIDNEQALQEKVLQLAADAKINPKKSEVWTVAEAEKFTLEQSIDDFVDELIYNERESAGGLISDLLSCAISRINFLELAEHYLEEVKGNYLVIAGKVAE